MQRRLGFFALCAVLAALAGCASTRPTQVLPASNASIEAFSMNGRVAVKIDDRGYTASLRWRHSATQDYMLAVFNTPQEHNMVVCTLDRKSVV